MGEITGISWCDSTFNPWIGCTKVGPGCDNCYAEAQDKRFGGAHWGPGAERKRTTPTYWRNLLKWNAKAPAFIAEHGHKQRVFIASQADVFDNEVSPDWQLDLFDHIRSCFNLEIIIVTKRVGNAKKLAPGGVFPSNVILLATVCNQAEADRDVPKLLALKGAGIALRIGLSIEPMLGPIKLNSILAKDDDGEEIWIDALTGEIMSARTGCQIGEGPALDWIIVGGESGPNARWMIIGHARDLMHQCQSAGVPFFMKQLGADPIWEDGAFLNIRHRSGADPSEWPEDLRVQEFPRAP